MTRTLVLTGCGLLALGSSTLVFCCVRVGALYDRSLSGYPPDQQRKEADENGFEPNSG